MQVQLRDFFGEVWLGSGGLRAFTTIPPSYFISSQPEDSD